MRSRFTGQAFSTGCQEQQHTSSAAVFYGRREAKRPAPTQCGSFVTATPALLQDEQVSICVRSLKLAAALESTQAGLQPQVYPRKHLLVQPSTTVSLSQGRPAFKQHRRTAACFRLPQARCARGPSAWHFM